jgi:hypothetical protein
VAAGTGQPYVVLAADHLRHLAVAPPDDGDRLVITGVSPPGDHQVGAGITVHGRNFAVPAERNQVTVGGVRVLRFDAGSDQSALVFDVPQVQGVPRVAPVVVSNDQGAAEWLISVVERVIVPKGEILLAEDFGDLAGQVIGEGETFTFWWRVRAATDVAATYRFRPLFAGSTGVDDDAWEAGAAVVDENGTKQDQFELEPVDRSDPFSRRVRVGVCLRVPSGARSVELALACEYPPASGNPDLNRPSPPVAVVVGEELALSDPRVSFSEPLLGAGGMVAPGGTLVVRPFKAVRLTVFAIVHEGGRFRFSAEVEPDAPGLWVLIDPVPGPMAVVGARDGGRVKFTVTLAVKEDDRHPARRLRVRVIGNPADSPIDRDRYESFVLFRLRTR